MKDKLAEIENAIKIILKAILNILSVVPILFFICENFKAYN